MPTHHPPHAPTPAPAGPAAPATPKPPKTTNEKVANVARAIAAGVLLVTGAGLLAFALGAAPGATVGALYACVAFGVSAALFAALGDWEVAWGMRASSIACIVGIVLSIGAFGIVLLRGVNEAQRKEDLAIIDAMTESQVDDRVVAAARKRLLGGDDAEVTIRDATDIARTDDAAALATEVLNPTTTNPRAKEVQALAAARNDEVAELQAKGWSGMLKEFSSKRQRELSHLGARLDAASTLVATVYLVPTAIVIMFAIGMTLYAAGQFGLSWGLKDPGSDAKLGAKVTYWFNRTILAPSTKFAVGAFALAWFPFWWADALLEAWVESAPYADHISVAAPEHTIKAPRPQKKDATEVCAKNRAAFTAQGIDLSLLPTVCR